MAKKKSVKKTTKKSSNKTAGKKVAEKKPANKSSGKKYEQEKVVRNVVILSVVIILGVLVFSFWINRDKTEISEFEYEGINFGEIEFCNPEGCLKTYGTKMPVNYRGGEANYTFYFRNNPKIFDDVVPFEGELELRKNVALNITYGRECGGYSKVGVENLGRMMGVFGMEIFKGNETEGKNATSLLIREGSQTKISQTGNSSYIMDISGCEILRGTERFMVEMLKTLNTTYHPEKAKDIMCSEPIVRFYVTEPERPYASQIGKNIHGVVVVLKNDGTKAIQGRDEVTECVSLGDLIHII
ncbi:MAG: hypothetical protein WDZ69_01055 [Candidatus Pacearchaeota archaeon]